VVRSFVLLFLSTAFVAQPPGQRGTLDPAFQKIPFDQWRGDGELVFFVQITDRDGARYQDHGSIDLSKLDENIKAANLEYSQRAFFLPGDYRLAVAILDTATGEHSIRQTQFRVAPRQRDLLPDAWRDLPPVEFIGKAESPDSWYLPDIHGRLRWAASVHSGPSQRHSQCGPIRTGARVASNSKWRFGSSASHPQSDLADRILVAFGAR
jgi:hypothetical protein